MKVVIVAPTYEPAWGYGGPAKLATTIANQLFRVGHQVTVVTTDALGPERNRSRLESDPRVIRCRNASNALAWRFKIVSPFTSGEALRAFKGADIVHLFQVRSLTTILGYYGAWLNHIPFVLSPLGGLPTLEGWPSIPKKIYDAVLLSGIRRKMSAILGQNSHEVSLCESWAINETRVHLVPLCVENDDPTNLPNKGEFIRKHPELSEFDQFYMFLGRIHKYKGIEMLMRAFQQAFQDENHALVVAGRDEGGHLQVLQDLAVSLRIQNRVFFPGEIYGRDKKEAFVDAHAFTITPSIFEETSLAALEAAACRTPVITTIQAEIPWLEKYSAGFISEFKLDAIRRNLVRMSRIVGIERDNMGLSARRLTDEHYSARAVTGEIERIYLSLIDS